MISSRFTSVKRDLVTFPAVWIPPLSGIQRAKLFKEKVTDAQVHHQVASLSSERSILYTPDDLGGQGKLDARMIPTDICEK